jgi:hypothetical protein
MARPKLPPGDARGNALRIRLTDDERAGMDRIAAELGEDTSAWARGVLLAALAKAERQAETGGRNPPTKGAGKQK